MTPLPGSGGARALVLSTFTGLAGRGSGAGEAPAAAPLTCLSVCGTCVFILVAFGDKEEKHVRYAVKASPAPALLRLQALWWPGCLVRGRRAPHPAEGQPRPLRGDGPLPPRRGGAGVPGRALQPPAVGGGLAPAPCLLQALPQLWRGPGRGLERVSAQRGPHRLGLKRPEVRCQCRSHLAGLWERMCPLSVGFGNVLSCGWLRPLASHA